MALNEKASAECSPPGLHQKNLHMTGRFLKLIYAAAAQQNLWQAGFVTNLCGSCATESMTGRFLKLIYAAAAQQNLWQAGIRGSCATESLAGRWTRQLRIRIYDRQVYTAAAQIDEHFHQWQFHEIFDSFFGKKNLSTWAQINRQKHQQNLWLTGSVVFSLLN